MAKLRANGDGQALIKALKHKDRIVRRDAARALGNIKTTEAVVPLIEAMKDVKFSVAFAAREALIKKGTPAVESLISALHDENRFVRWNAAEILGEIQDANAVKPLSQVLQNGDAYLRGSSAWALGKIGDAEAVEALTELLSDTDPYVQKQVRKALKRMLRGMILQVLAIKSELTEDEKQGLKDKSLELAQILNIEVQFPKTQESTKSQSQLSNREKGGKSK